MKEKLKQWFARAPKALELKPGGIYVIAAESPMCGEEFDGITAYLDKFTKQTGCKFLILDAGFRMVLDKERPE